MLFKYLHTAWLVERQKYLPQGEAFNRDLILMDISLPDISGYEATRLILLDNPGIKIIAQTAYAANTEHQKAMDAGCVDYISQLTKEEQLLTMLSKYLK